MIQFRAARTLVAYIMATALRDRLFLAFLVLTALAAGIGMFIGGAAIVEKRELSVAYVATATRLIMVIGLVLFVCFYLRRSFESREVELMLSRPISRTAFVLAHVISFIAGLGRAFRSTDRDTDKSELVIFLRATIVRNDSVDEYDIQLYDQFGEDRRPLVF